MELRSVAYNSNNAPGMQEMSEQEMQGMHAGYGVQMGSDMQGMQMAAPGFVSYDVSGAMCASCGAPIMNPCCPPPCPPPCPPAPRVYVVRKGDTVYNIARRFGTTIEAIVQENNLRNPDRIYPGQILLIPTTGFTGEFFG